MSEICEQSDLVDVGSSGSRAVTQDKEIKEGVYNYSQRPEVNVRNKLVEVCAILERNCDTYCDSVKYGYCCDIELQNIPDIGDKMCRRAKLMRQSKCE